MIEELKSSNAKYIDEMKSIKNDLEEIMKKLTEENIEDEVDEE